LATEKNPKIREGLYDRIFVIKYMRKIGHTVAMCGDGGNDCGALRNAHAGLALQGRPDAIIASPFSTSSDSLNALTILMKEARASVSTPKHIFDLSL
jgi:P-type E1-E2 ATPase